MEGTSSTSSILMRLTNSTLKIITVVLIISILCAYMIINSSGYLISKLSTFQLEKSISHETSRSIELLPDSTLQSAHEDLSNFRNQCNTHELDRLGVMNTSDGLTSVTLQMSSKTVNCPRKLQTITFPYNRTLFISFPGSGNTWVRHLLQELTGLPTGSVYNDMQLKNNGFPFEGKLNGVVAIKSHSLNLARRKKLLSNSKRVHALLLIRNPFSALFAEYKRDRMGLSHSGNGYVDNTDEKWEQFITGQSEEYMRMYREVLLTDMNKIVVFYEDLVENRLPQLIRIAKFLSNANLTEFSFCCALKNGEGEHHRASNNQTVDAVFTNSQRTIVNSAIERLVEDIYAEHPAVGERLLTYRMPLELLKTNFVNKYEYNSILIEKLRR